MRNGSRKSQVERPKCVLVLGSGALQIGQAGEFDYSGSQALKALKEEGIRTVLINPNIATVQTSNDLADAVYLLPVTPHFVEQVLVTECVDALLLSFGGQTALNCGLQLDAAGTLAKHNVSVLGTPVESIRAAEDRALFAAKMSEIGVKVARSRAATNADEALEAAKEIGFPIIFRAAFSLGGKGSSIVWREEDFAPAALRAFSGVPQVLVEECLYGWKEIEYEVVRDERDNCIAVCNMENVDPIGIHTGESIVVAPSQTLNDAEYQMLRDLSLRIARHLGIVGECNVQFALDPKSNEYRVIEVNPRLSRSSALASKATGYPLAYIAAKIAIHCTLPELSNAVTGTTSAFCEPALDYVVCKIPRWDFDKFAGVDSRIGTEMKSVGEVMAIGRSFPEVLQKAIRMLEIGADGLNPQAFAFGDLRDELRRPSPRRIFAVARAFDEGLPLDEVAHLTAIDSFFLGEIARLLATRKQLQECSPVGEIPQGLLLTAKMSGFSDSMIAQLTRRDAEQVRARRRDLGVRARMVQIDTLAAEYPAQTNYVYLTYSAPASEILPTTKKKVLVLGSGCYRIGSSVEFDWCCVNAVNAARELGFETVMLNCNPETVSTDHDSCDLLVFDELSFEAILEIVDAVQPEGVIVSMGGQTPNTLAMKLHAAGVKIFGTPPQSIDRSEDRRKFSSLCDELKIDQPRWSETSDVDNLEILADSIGGFPVLVRPSYVLSGAAMRVAHNATSLKEYLERATLVSAEHPVVLSKFERHAREIELDAVAVNGEIVLWCVSEHVEDAGVHSGDATLVIPPQELYSETIRRVRRIGERLAQALNVTGPFNLQLLARHNDVKVIECNLRASRSFPFVSKVLGRNFAKEATRLMLGTSRSAVAPQGNPLDSAHVAVKVPQFSFRRLAGADPILGVEMASTGEAACLGDDFDEALLKAMTATGFVLPCRGVLLSLGPVGDKYRFSDEAATLVKMGLPLFATQGTAEILRREGIDCQMVDKMSGAIEKMRNGQIDLVINVPREYDAQGRPDGFHIRRAAIDFEIPLITDLWVARKMVRAMSRYTIDELKIKPLHAYVG